MTYQNFIDGIIKSRGQFNCGDEYHERHHIKPKCLGGTDDLNNLIDLYAREHFIAHKLLAEENPSNIKLVQAYSIMAFASNEYEKRYELTPEEYEQARKAFSIGLKQYYSNKENHPCYGKHLSEERKQKIREANKGNKYCVGRIISKETRKKIGDANRNPSSETRKKMSEAQKARNLDGGNNPRAKKIIRLSDLKIYDCIKEAAEDNQIVYSTLKSRLSRTSKDFMYYDEWKKLQK